MNDKRCTIDSFTAQHGWTFTTQKGTIASIQEAEQLSQRLASPLPTMTFPHNGLEVVLRRGDRHARLTMHFTCEGALAQIARTAPPAVKVGDFARSSFWQQKSASLDVASDYDWTFWSTYEGDLHDPAAPPGAAMQWEETEERIDYARLADQSRPVSFFDSIDLYEEEMADAGASIYDVKIRVMPFGFLIRLRSFLIIDHVAIRCAERRYYHDFGDGPEAPPTVKVLLERRTYESDFDAFFAEDGPGASVGARDIDSIVACLPVTSSTTHRLVLHG